MSVRFLEELKRRRVIRALLSYGLFAFAVLQVIEPVMHAFHWPEAVLTATAVALGVGFPVTAALAWVFDLGWGGLVRTPEPPGASEPLRRPRVAALVLGIGIAAAAPGVAWYLFLRAGSAPRGPLAVAVLPFENLSGDRDSEAFADGMTEELMNALAQLPDLRVAARASSFTFKGKRAALGDIGERLGVTHVVEGSVRRAEGRIRVTARMEDVATGTQVWASSFEEPLSDVFALQASLARAIAGALHRPPEDAVRPGSTTGSIRAYELYVKGRYHWAARPVQWREALDAYQQAVQEDPRFALAWAGLAEAYATLGSWENGSLAPGEAFPKAREAAQHALEIEPALAEAHSVLGYVLTHYDRAFEAAEREFQTALRLRPDLPGIHHWYSHLLVATGRKDESLRESLRTQALDPLDPVHAIHLSWHHFFTGDAEKARVLASGLAEREPHQFWYPWFVALADLQTGNAEAAVRSLSSPAVQDKPYTFLDAQRALALGALGRMDEVRAIEARLLARRQKGYVPAYDLALVRLALGDRAGALRGLREAVDEHSAWAAYLAVDPRLAPLRGTPELGEVLAAAGLGPPATSAVRAARGAR